MELLVYKASAGSGKTFTLAVEYIKHLILNPRAYRQILAVTFTNTASGKIYDRKTYLTLTSVGQQEQHCNTCCMITAVFA